MHKKNGNTERRAEVKIQQTKLILFPKRYFFLFFCLIYDLRYVFMLDLYLHLSFEWRTLFQFLSLFPPLDFVLYFHFAFCDLTFRICLVIEDSCFRAASIFSFVSPTPLSHSLYQLCRIVITIISSFIQSYKYINLIKELRLKINRPYFSISNKKASNLS